jgi:hypothetical protein
MGALVMQQCMSAVARQLSTACTFASLLCCSLAASAATFALHLVLPVPVRIAIRTHLVGHAGLVVLNDNTNAAR